MHQVTRITPRDEAVLAAMVLKARSRIKVTKAMLTVTAPALKFRVLATPTIATAVMLRSKATAMEFTVLVTTL